MYMKKRILCAAALALLLAAGCGSGNNMTSPAGQEPPPAENSEAGTPRQADGERTYSIPLGDSWDAAESWIIDKDGNEVTLKEAEQAGYTETDLTDLATGETGYRCRMRNEIIRDGQGYPRTHRLCALYDLSGNQLIDWEEKDYYPAFGEFIIRKDSLRGMASADDIMSGYRTALYHVPTGKESYEGAFSAVKLDGGNFLLLDSQNTTLGVVNYAGEMVSGFPMPNPYYNVYMRNGHLTASSMNPYEQTKENRGVEYLLDGNLKELFSAEWMSDVYGALRGDYIAYRNGDDWGIYQPGKGVVFTTDGASIEYYDGELAIVQEGSYRGDEPINAALVTSDNREITGGFSWLRPAQAYEEETPAQKFLGLLDGKAVLIDRAGNILASSPELPHIMSANTMSVNTLCDGLYDYYVETDELYGQGLLGSDLEVLVPAGRYTGISLARGFYPGSGDWDGRAETALLEAQKMLGTDEPGRGIYRMDILDHTGKVIVDNVTGIYDVGPDRIALRRGFDVGLMDWEGNWIVKRRIFTGFGND